MTRVIVTLLGTKLIIQESAGPGKDGYSKYEWDEVDTYCNMNRPPQIFYSRYEVLQIEYVQPKTTLQIYEMEFFEASYSFEAKQTTDIISSREGIL